MKSEDVKQMATNAIETLAAALEAGKSDDLKRYLAAMGRFHRYSLHNVMLIALQKPTASHVVVTRHVTEFSASGTVGTGGAGTLSTRTSLISCRLCADYFRF